MPVVTTLTQAVLPLIRTRADQHRWSAANAHGGQMHEAVNILEAAIPPATARRAPKVAATAKVPPRDSWT